MTLETGVATKSGDAGQINGKVYLAGATAILLLAFGLRMLGVTAHSIWFDEAVEYFTASAPLSHLPLAVVAANYQPPLFSFLLHLWLQIGLEPIWQRSLPLVFSMLTVAGLMSWSGRIFGRRGAILAGLIIAAMPTEAYYAQDVGEYALLIFAVTWALYFLDLACRRSSWRYWLFWALLSLVGVYAHYGAAIIIVPAAVLVLLENIRNRRREAIIRELLTICLSVIVVIPLFLFFLPDQIGRVDQGLNAVAPFASIAREVTTFISSLDDVFLYNLVGWPVSTIPTWPATGILIAALILVVLLRPHLPKMLYAWFACAYISYFVLARTGLYAGSFGFRYGLIFTPLFVLLLVAIINELYRRRWPLLGSAALILILALELYALPTPAPFKVLPGQQTWVPQEAMAELFDYWQEQRQADESTFVYYGAVPAFRYYLRLNDLDKDWVSLQARPSASCTSDQAEEVCQDNNLFYSPWVRHLSSDEKIRDMEEIMGGLPDRLWLVFSHVHETEKEDMLHLLEDDYRVERMDQPGAGEDAIYLLVRSSA